MEHPEFAPAPGSNCVVTLDGEVVTKVTRTALRPEDAAHMAKLVTEYAAALEAQPISTARLLDCGTVETRDGLYAVRHTMGFVPGRALSSLQGPDAQAALTRVVRGLCAMTTLGGEQAGLLEVPLDWNPGNWIVDLNGELVHVDLYLPYVRRQGKIALVASGIVGAEHAEQNHAQLTSIIPSLLERFAPRASDGNPQQWMSDTLPPEMDPALRDSVEYYFDGLVRTRGRHHNLRRLMM